MIQGHGGDIFTIATIIGCRPEDIVDFSSNINPLGPPAALLDFLAQQTPPAARDRQECCTGLR